MPSKKNRNVGHCPKRWEGVKNGSQIFHIVQMGHRGVGGRERDGNVPNASHNFFKLRGGASRTRRVGRSVGPWKILTNV